MQNTYINSKSIVADVLDNFAIKSEEFIARSPVWIRNCLRSLKIYQVYRVSYIDGSFDNYRFQLPDFCETVTKVSINDKPVDLYNTVLEKGTFKSQVDDKELVLTPYSEEYNSNFRTVKTEYPELTETPYYYLDNNWIKTNVPNGTIQVEYKGIPCIFDSDWNLTFPLVYDVELLKEYIRYYILMMLLQRGYVHPIFTLKGGNQYNNPKVYLDVIRGRVRTDCNKFTNERRSNIADILTTFNYGN